MSMLKKRENDENAGWEMIMVITWETTATNRCWTPRAIATWTITIRGRRASVIIQDICFYLSLNHDQVRRESIYHHSRHLALVVTVGGKSIAETEADWSSWTKTLTETKTKTKAKIGGHRQRPWQRQCGQILQPTSKRKWAGEPNWTWTHRQ